MKNIGLLALALVLPLVSTGAQQQTSDASHSALASKRPPQARSWAEYNDYKSTYALNGGLAVEKAADDFATKYPQSELREYLYSKAMHEYQKENNPQKILAMGERVLSLDADDSIALVLTGTVIADQLGDGDKNRDEEIAEIETNCKHALETVDAGYTPPSNVAPEQIAAYKSTIQSMAHSALGIMELKTSDYAGAEKDLRAAADSNRAQPDPYIWYHMALAEDHLRKYADALVSVDKALQYIGANSDLESLARGERQRLEKLTDGVPIKQ